MKVIVSLTLVLTIALPLRAFGHSGGTNEYGCHEQTSTGNYHCHNDGEITGDPTSFDVYQSGMFAGFIWAIGVVATGVVHSQHSERFHGEPLSLVLLLVPICSQVVAIHLGNRAEQERGEDPALMLGVLWGMNIGLVVWDVLIVLGVFEDDERPESGFLDYDGDGLAIGLPTLVVTPESVALPDLIRVSF